MAGGQHHEIHDLLDPDDHWLGGHRRRDFQVLAGFAMGVLAVIGTSLAVGLAAASVYDRGHEWDP